MYHEEITSKSKFSFNWKELVQYKELFFFFTWRDIKVKYKQTFLGFAWAILQPLFMSLIFVLFFSKVITNEVDLTIPYPLFVLTGMLLWSAFSNGLSNAANSMVNNANIIKKIYFPRLIVPISAILVSLFDFLMSFLILIPVMIYYKVSFSWYALITIPLSVIITLVSSLGMGSFLSALNIKYRDFRYVIPFLIQVLLFLTPVIYPANITSSKILHTIVTLNPMTAAINLFRASFSQNLIITDTIIISSCTAILFLFIGLFYFRKTEHYFADLV